MSDVRLSNGSPTLERTESRLSDHPKPSACRSLFGPVDHDELKRELEGHMREMEQAAAAKWGFDFAAHSPLPLGSGMQWELVDRRDVPDFYSRQRRAETGACPAGISRVDLNGNHSCVVGEAERDAGSCTEQCAGLRKRAPGAPHSRVSRVSPAEPSAPRKRSHSSSEEVTRAEHTPRKSSPSRQT
ncbi:cyclin-dependent kinase inhibitor 1Bb [Synchiropus splendidus]|uniref:cyclin-dependent kinase inhibitor 1Bb n=1 Tax=Synchiropus splendidus TaxID=270530 RepID=UPI00237D32CF|nr:cyclin-dependent kinase inhibitor 1Bb [Synchiropus splendidus]